MVGHCNSDSAHFELFFVSGDDVVNGVVQACDCPIQNWKLDHSLPGNGLEERLAVC